MSQSVDIVEEALKCVECDRQLPQGATYCVHCSAAPTLRLEDTRSVEQFLRRARGQLLFGAVFLPWLFAPLALQNTIRARTALAQLGKTDTALSASISRLQIIASVATVVGFALVAGFLLRTL